MKSKVIVRVLAGAALALATAASGYPQAAPADEEPRSAGTDVAVPKRSKFVQPQYPAAALAQGLRGIVILALTIDTSGKVSAVDIVRSLPPFDEAATAAARQWEYEVTRVDGKPVPVRLTVPITFALKLPEVSRAQGIPELRQGVSPPIPTQPVDQPARESVTVTADLTVDPSGQVVEAEITNGISPWSEALLQALRTWRFTPTGGDRQVTFEVRADFLLAGRGSPRVELGLSDLRQAQAPPAEAAAAEPAPAASTPSAPAAASAPAGATPAPATETAAATPPPAPVSPAAEPPRTPANETAPPAPTPAATPPSAAPVTAPANTAPASAAGAPPPPTTAPESIPPAPTVEIIPPTPEPPKPVEPGVSAVQDVALGPGVPDLSRGRRPVAPPIARMNAVSGNVEVRFVVEASGSSTVRDVAGPELLKEAARQTVSSWMFRRITPERLPLLAVLSYVGDAATASVTTGE